VIHSCIRLPSMHLPHYCVYAFHMKWQNVLKLSVLEHDVFQKLQVKWRTLFLWKVLNKHINYSHETTEYLSHKLFRYCISNPLRCKLTYRYRSQSEGAHVRKLYIENCSATANKRYQRGYYSTQTC